MGDLYGSGGGGGGGGRRGDLYGSGGGGIGPPPGPSKKTAKSGGHHGFFGTIEEAATNFAKGAEQSVIGLPHTVSTLATSAYEDVRHNPWLAWAGPVTFLPGEFWLNVAGHKTQLERNVVAPLAHQYAWKYGPLFQGHPGTTLSRAFVKDPFGTSLDIATAASLGAAAVGKLLPAEATALRELPLRGPEALARAGRLDKVLTKDVVIMNEGKPATIGARAVRGTAYRHRLTHAALNALPADLPGVGELARFNKRLSRDLRVDTSVRRLRALDYDRSLRKLNVPERQALSLLSRWPLPRTLDAMIEKWRGGKMDPSEVGALQIATDPKVRAIFDNYAEHPNIVNALAEAKKLGEQDAKMLEKYGSLSPEAAAEAPYLHMRVATGAEFVPDGEGGHVLQGGASIDELNQALAAEGRPTPTYLHDTAVDKPKGGPSFAPSGGGTSPVPRSVVFRNEATLASMGQLLLDPGTLLSQHFRSVRYGLFRDLHAGLEQVALRVPKGTKLPEGYQFLRRAVGPTGKTPERIGYVEQTAGEYQRWLEENLPARQTSRLEQKLGIGKGEISPEAEQNLYNELTTRNAEDANILELPNGDRLIVPNSTLKAVAGEYQRSSAAARWFIERPLDVWRALLLNWSPRWLVNNIVGNSAMALLRFGGPHYIRAWLAAVAEHAAPGVWEKFLKNSGLTEADMMELLPELVTGTFKGQNMPFRASVTAGRLRNLMREGLSPIDRTYEQALRRAAANAVAASSPEVRAILRQMPKQTRSFREATKQALAENPVLRKKIIQEVDSGLGNFRDLSFAERNYIRRLIPFYGWYRAITGVVLKLPLEVPIRVNFIAHLSQIQQEDQDLLNPGLAPWLRGGVPFGKSGLVYTQGINPYATVAQIGRGAQFAATGGDLNAARTFLGLLNPNLQSLPTLIPQHGQRSPGLLWTLLQGTYGNLPPVALTKLGLHGAPPSKLYQPSTLDQLLSQLGVPVRHLQQPIVQR